MSEPYVHSQDRPWMPKSPDAALAQQRGRQLRELRNAAHDLLVELEEIGINSPRTIERLRAALEYAR